MTNKTVAILGATGFLGVRLAAQLNEKGYRIKALTRHKSRHKELLVLPNVELIEANTHHQASLEQHFSSCSAVINLVGILNENGHKTHTFQNAHVELVRTIVNACKTASIPHLIHVSALNADSENGSSEYLVTKGMGESLAFELSGDRVAVTVLRPSVIFGPQDHFFNRFASLLNILPWFPLACGHSRLAPVYIDDVCAKIIEALENPSSVGKRINLVGPKEYTLHELVSFTAKTIGINKPIINLPDWAARLQARIMEWIPGKPFSIDNYNSLQTDSICDEQNAKQTTSIEAIVPGYIGNKNRNAKYQAFRQAARRS